MLKLELQNGTEIWLYLLRFKDFIGGSFIWEVRGFISLKGCLNPTPQRRMKRKRKIWQKEKKLRVKLASWFLYQIDMFGEANVLLKMTLICIIKPWSTYEYLEKKKTSLLIYILQTTSPGLKLHKWPQVKL